MDAKIKKILDEQKIKYVLLSHKTVYTAFNAAETQHISTGQVAKTVLLKLSAPVSLNAQKPAETIKALLAVVPAGKRVSLKKVGKAAYQEAQKAYKAALKGSLKAKKPAAPAIKLASEKDIAKMLKTKVGLISPIGRLYGLPVFLDKKLTLGKQVVIPAGSYTHSAKLSVKDFIKLSSPIVGIYSE